jgi:hypothetical protein
MFAVVKFCCVETPEVCGSVICFKNDDLQCCKLFFFCEGLRSRCYGNTAALRFIVQPCDEEE